MSTAEAIEDRYGRYARKFVNDTGAPDTSDARLAEALAGCARPPRPDEYPAIRAHVATYLDGRGSRVRDLRTTLLDRAESYSRDAQTFADMPRVGQTSWEDFTEEDCKRYAATYRIVADELRKVAASL